MKIISSALYLVAILLSACGGGSGSSNTTPTPTYTLSVTTPNNGTVTSNPPGINCGADCSEPYAQDTAVTLSAIPANGYQFTGWSGACSGTCSVTMNADATVSATFAAITTPTCSNRGVLYDTNGTNGYGWQYVANTGIANFSPIDIAFIPDSANAFMVASQGGYVHYFNGGCTPVNTVDLRATLPVGTSSGEQGLLNVEFHPDYATNGYVFFYHTTVASTVNSVTRMTATFDAGGNLVLGNPQRIIDFRKADAAAASNHNGGGLVFAADKTLLASIGDGGSSSSTAQADERLLGKVIRIQPSLAAGTGGYTIPAGNMFAATNPLCSDITLSAQACPEILAKGLRNPFRMARDGDIIYLGDVGSGTEEVNSFLVTNNTANFGWPTHDGYVGSSTLPGYRNPIVYYTRSGATANAFRAEDPMATATGSASVMIGDVYRGSRYTAAMNGGALLFGEFYDGFVRAVGVDASGNITDGDGVPGFHLVHEDGISSMVQGPDGYVYLTALYGSPMVYRLVLP